jgi:uncharacterized protein (DUF2147 family)
MLMVLGSSASTAQAGDSYSFVIGGHRIHVEARQGCRSLSCVSWSDGATRNRRDRGDDPTPAKPAAAPQAPAEPAPAALPPQQPAPAPAPQIQASQIQAPQARPAPPPVVTAPLATKVAAETVAPTPAIPNTIELASTTTQSVPPPAPKPETRTVAIEKAPLATPAAPAKAREEEVAPNTPLGDWQTEGKKGLVRIEQCGKSLCGYVLNEQTSAKGETVLSNMKPKSDNKWTGDIFSRASGNSYYAKMSLKAPNTLHVEACAVLRFFCSGNDWTRVPNKPEVVISRQSMSQPNS